MKKTNTATRHYGLYTAIMWVPTLLLLIPFIMTLSRDASDNPTVVLYVLFFLLFACLWIYYLVQWIYYRNVKLTEIQETTLAAVEVLWKDVFGFRCEVTMKGLPAVVTTKHVFHTFFANPLDEYSGKTIEIGYNEKRDEWIVL